MLQATIFNLLTARAVVVQLSQKPLPAFLGDRPASQLVRSLGTELPPSLDSLGMRPRQLTTSSQSGSYPAPWGLLARVQITTLKYALPTVQHANSALGIPTGSLRMPIGIKPPSIAAEQPSAEIADWTREKKRFLAWDPSRSLIKSIRLYQRHSSGFLRRPVRVYAILCHRFWSAITGADIPINSTICGGLLLPHPNGIVVHPKARIGPNCLLFQQVTLGGSDTSGFPILEGHVDVGAGAKVLGGVRLGAHARIGANAVVLADVPAGAHAVGVPARIVGRSAPACDVNAEG